MTTVTIPIFRKNIYSFVKNTIRYNDPFIISSKDGNAVIISEEDYRALIESVFISLAPDMRDKLIEGLLTPLSETVTEEKMDW